MNTSTHSYDYGLTIINEWADFINANYNQFKLSTIDNPLYETSMFIHNNIIVEFQYFREDRENYCKMTLVIPFIDDEVLIHNVTVVTVLHHETTITIYRV